ncbi:MAG: hypothetical protein NVV72_10345 [Asticcacaulis sp.]|nr:hypothetical protein [Asticcacaulis sp.]
MNRKLTRRASHVLNLLPVAHGLMRTTPSAHLLTAAAVVRHPIVRRLATGLSAAATVGLAAFAVAAFVKGLKTRSTNRTSGKTAGLERSSVT